MPRILIVEDEATISQMYKYKLTKAGFRVKIANNGEQGLVFAREFHPDLILLDLRMPKMDGGDMLESLRSYSWGSDISVIILTNISRAEAPKNLQFLGVDRYIVKAHTTPSQIVLIVKSILAARN